MAYLPLGPKTKAFSVPITFATDESNTQTIGKLAANSGVNIGDVTLNAGTAEIGKLAAGTAHIGEVDVGIIANYPNAPVQTVYTPSTTAYVKITPDPTNLHMEISPRTTSDDLIYASVLTHKIADATTITSAAPTTDETDRLRATEFKNDCNTHMASLTYHEVAGPAITADDATDDATLIALCQEIDLDLKAHAASTTQHGGRADAVFVAALASLALPATPSKAECRTYLADAALKAAWDAHRVITNHLAGVQVYAVHAAGTPKSWDCDGSLFCRCSTSGATFVTEEYRA
jgi:hypothetical protein